MPVIPDTPQNRQAAGGLLRAGGVVAYPTDTLYGLGASIFHIAGVNRVYEIKGRPQGQPLPVLVSSPSQLTDLALDILPEAHQLADYFWPGPLTLVLRRHYRVPLQVTGGLDTVAVRQPAHPAPLMLIEECGTPITGTSANRSGGTQPTTAQEVVRQLGDAVDMVLDAGACELGAPSTILDLTVMPARVLRLGALSLEEVRRICPVRE